jgi:hypothetical protein
MLGGGLVFVILGMFLGVVLSPVVLGLAVYSLKIERPRARRAERIALGLATFAVVLSWPLWNLAFTGRRDDPNSAYIWDDAVPSFAFLAEAATLATAIAVVVRNALRRRARTT